MSTPTSQPIPGDADSAALIRAFIREDEAAFDLMTSGDWPALLAAFGLACKLLIRAAGSVEAVDAALQHVIDFNREWE